MAGLSDRNDLPLLRAGDLADEILADAAGVAVRKVAERRATFSRANILAEVHRQFQGVRFASPDDRIAVAERTADLAVGQSLLISVPELHYTPERLRRADGTSRFRAKGHEIYTTAILIEAEARLLEAGRETDGPTVATGTVAAVTGATTAGPGPFSVHRSGRRRGADRHLRAHPRRVGRTGRHRKVDHHGRAAGRLGSRARGGLGARSGPLGRRSRGAGRSAGDRDGEHRQVAP